LLLHLVEILPLDGSDPVDNILAIENELAAFSEELIHKPRWLVFNKIDCFTPDEAKERIQDIMQRLSYTGPIYAISALAKTGTVQLCEDIMQFLQKQPRAFTLSYQEDEAEDPQIEG